MEIPTSGGVLFMPKLPTNSAKKRPSTVQMWLTKDKLWLIKTTHKLPEVKELAYPNPVPRAEAENILMGYSSNFRMSSTTISEQTIGMLNRGMSTVRPGMNGKLQITEGGVVFLQPNEY
ncbi:MAG: hypothetical protein U9O87_08800 [Verrucomicrobiota bacterium]|nr:hypothetical protein [Verrucomicrobiota bacterium]